VEGPIDMTTRFTGQRELLRGFALAASFLAGIAAPSSAAPPSRERMITRCHECTEANGTAAHPRVVGLKIYNQPDLTEAGISHILETANRIWKPYGISVEASNARDAVAVVVSRRASQSATDSRPTVLGDTLFTDGQATPYIHLWPANAEALAAGSEMDGRPFTSRSRVERDAILLQILGVALAHELAHYLLNTANHSAVGLLRGTISVNDLAFPQPGHLRLTHDQERLICLEGDEPRWRSTSR